MERIDPRLHEELLELAELASLELLEPADERRLSAHLRAGCAECAERYDLGVRTAAVLAQAVDAARPDPRRRAQLLSEVAAPPAERASARSGFWVAAPALAAGIAVLIAVGAMLSARRVERDAADAIRLARAEIDARIGEGDARYAALSTRLLDFEAAIARFGESRVRQVTLAGDAAFGDASARVVVDPAGHQVLLLASRLPPAPPGRTYQLWVIVSGAPESLGVFDSDAGGRALHVESRPFELADEFSVAISVEPVGGVPQPTGPIVLMSH